MQDLVPLEESSVSGAFSQSKSRRIFRSGNIRALLITYTILGVPSNDCSKYSIIYPNTLVYLFWPLHYCQWPAGGCPPRDQSRSGRCRGWARTVHTTIITMGLTAGLTTPRTIHTKPHIRSTHLGVGMCAGGSMFQDSDAHNVLPVGVGHLCFRRFETRDLLT